ncbi:hypothetical protein AMAG_08771 [Allomyces macrogynus ATCC 38327]|uniref:F-box domain-containing protein n=1 Tax=Allomyces macrogynus (strain ATCC 38327) TaxID=578462 RepID=A0A0L0SMH0_ALLM3|nr:hypothetical protein AMAG_08771 [Allomyces macrogynus ATCC 38327]|eukprot:KNE63673.1 hypothetical protein AMAG_08771 [Allomyces macrogynus ATCC 38327]
MALNACAARPALIDDTSSSPAAMSLNNASMTLDNIPSDVLRGICRHVNVVDRVSLAFFALAAPVFFAPAVHAMLSHRGTWRVDPHSDIADMAAGVMLGDSGEFGVMISTETALYPIGAFGLHLDADGENIVKDSGGRPRRSLFLPPRDPERAFLADIKRVSRRDMLVAGCSSKWSLLPIRDHQIRFFSARFKWLWLAPSACNTLHLIVASTKVSRNQLATMPPSVQQLVLHFAVDRKFDLDHAKQVVDALPPALSSLTVQLDPAQGDLFSYLLDRVPSTVRRLTVNLDGDDETDASCYSRLVECLQRLTSLVSLSLDLNSGPASLEPIVLALRYRKRLRDLTLNVTLRTSDETADCERLEQLLPTGLDRLVFAVISEHHFEPMSISFPPAARELGVARSKWPIEVGRSLPLPSTLTRLDLIARFAERWHPAALVHIIPRLPASLTTLVLDGMNLHDYGTFALLASHWPPKLQSLKLSQCALKDSNFSGMTRQWPQTLTRLDLSSNLVTTVPVPLPPHLRALVLKNLMYLDCDKQPSTWIAALPTTLQVLDLREFWAMDAIAARLVAWTQPDRAQRVSLGVEIESVDGEVMEQLKTVFHVFE